MNIEVRWDVLMEKCAIGLTQYGVNKVETARQEGSAGPLQALGTGAWWGISAQLHAVVFIT